MEAILNDVREAESRRNAATKLTEHGEVYETQGRIEAIRQRG